MRRPKIDNSTISRRRRALVIGGSLGGLFAAHLLRGAGWDAVVRQLVIRRGDRTWPISDGELHFRAATESLPAAWRAGARFVRLEDVYNRQ
jgi:hypothetical protein